MPLRTWDYVSSSIRRNGMNDGETVDGRKCTFLHFLVTSNLSGIITIIRRDTSFS